MAGYTIIKTNNKIIIKHSLKFFYRLAGMFFLIGSLYLLFGKYFLNRDVIHPSELELVLIIVGLIGFLVSHYKKTIQLDKNARAVTVRKALSFIKFFPRTYKHEESGVIFLTEDAKNIPVTHGGKYSDFVVPQYKCFLNYSNYELELLSSTNQEEMMQQAKEIADAMKLRIEVDF